MDENTLSDLVFSACNNVEDSNPATHGGKGYSFGVAIFNRLKPLVCDKPATDRPPGDLAKTVRKPKPAPKFIVRTTEVHGGDTCIAYAYPLNVDTGHNRQGKNRDDRKHAHEFDSIEGAEALLKDTPWWRWPTIEILDASNDQVVKVVKAPKVRYVVKRDARLTASSGFITRPVSPDDPDFRSNLTSDNSRAHDFGSREAAQRWCNERNQRYGIVAYRVVEAPKVEAPKVRYVVRRFYSGHDFGYLVRPIPCEQREIGSLDLDISRAHDFGSREAAQRWCDERVAYYHVRDTYHVLTIVPEVEAPKVRYVVKRDGVGTGQGFLGSLIPLEVSNPGAYLYPSSQKAYDFGSREAAQKYATERIHARGLSADFYRVVVA